MPRPSGRQRQEGHPQTSSYVRSPHTRATGKPSLTPPKDDANRRGDDRLRTHVGGPVAWWIIDAVMADSVEVEIEHRTLEQLQAGLAHIREAPADAGTLEMIVARPAVDERVLLASGELDVERGLVADRWSRGS